MIKKSWFAVTTLFIGMALIMPSMVSAQAQSTTTAQVTPDQQVQLDRLKALEQDLQKDRQGLHDAITQYGWDSAQVDAAQEQLNKDRLEYRKLRRSLRQAGVAVPAPQGWGAGGGMGGPGMPGMRGGHKRMHGDCPCAKAKPQPQPHH